MRKLCGGNSYRIYYNKYAKYSFELQAADVLQTVFHLCYKGNFDKIMLLEQIDILSLFFSSFIHDYKYRGYTNMLLINSQDDIAYRYNGINIITLDLSPLENYHLSEAFNISKGKNLDIFLT